MADSVSPERRSEIMSKIRGKDTGPEIKERRLIHRMGYRYPLHASRLPGRPDLVFPRHRLVVFIDGCFWHGCPAHYTVPGTRPEFWADKVRSNVNGDRKNTIELERKGWRVIRIWEHSVKKDPERVAGRICSLLSTGKRLPRRRDWRVVQVKRLAGQDMSFWRMEDLRSGGLYRMERRGGKIAKSAKGPKTT